MMYKAMVRLYIVDKNNDNNLIKSAILFTESSDDLITVVNSARDLGSLYVNGGSHDAFDFELIY